MNWKIWAILTLMLLSACKVDEPEKCITVGYKNGTVVEHKASGQRGVVVAVYCNGFYVDGGISKAYWTSPEAWNIVQ